MLDKKGLTMYLIEKGSAQIMNVAPKTFYRWLEKGIMPTDKAEILIDVLKIKNPAEIFFANM